VFKTVLYIATSLDGFIARPDGSLDWLTSVPSPETGDYGYAAFLERIGTTIMGRLTYDEIIGFGVEWPYAGLDTYVATKNSALKIQSPDTYLLTEDLREFVTELKRKAKNDIWLVGGGQLITAFINEGLLDKMCTLPLSCNHAKVEFLVQNFIVIRGFKAQILMWSFLIIGV